MKHLLAFALALVHLAAFALQPSDVQITADPQTSVVVAPRKTNTGKVIGISINPQDTVSLNGKQLYPAPTPTNHHGGIAVSDPSTWPTPQPGVAVQMLSDPTPLPAPADPSNWEADGAFRLVCNWGRMAYDDPVVYPGQPGAAHHHTFFGNTGTDANSTTTSLLATGNATCRGGTINKTAYWVPSMIGADGVPIAPASLLVYYKTGNCTYMAQCGGNVPGQTLPLLNLQMVPHGLKMIAGDATRSTPGGVGTFSCLIPSTGSSRVGTIGSAIPQCQSGEWLQMMVAFPECWDGAHLDSADHKSHMAYATVGAFVAGKQWSCPADHPVVLPRITYIVSFPITTQDTSTWRLASDVYAGPAGYSAHGDYMEAWTPGIPESWTVECLQKRRNCGSTQLGDGRTTLEFQGN